MKEVNHLVYLPEKIIKKLNSISFSKQSTIKDKSIKLLNRIVQKVINDNTTLTLEDYIPLSKEYLILCLGGSYNRTITFLKKENIIQQYINEKGRGYSTTKKECKRYRINSDLISESFAASSFSEESEGESDFEFEKIEMRKLEIDLKLAFEFMEKTISEIKVWTKEEEKINRKQNLIKINGDINQEYVFLEGFKKPVSLNKALSMAKDKGVDLIEQERNSYILMSIDKFIYKKKIKTRFYYTIAINKLSKKILFANRNKTNNRLDTNLTQLPNVITDNCITLNKEKLISIDLCNSQFTFLSYLISLIPSINSPSNTYSSNMVLGYSCEALLYASQDLVINKGNNELKVDVLDFIENSQSGYIYEFIAEMRNIERDKAKELLFQVMFSKHKSSSKDKTIIKEAFPSVFELIKQWKIRNGDNDFSIMLQKLEAQVFIDIIYPKLKAASIPAYPKHDSFLVPLSYQAKAEQIIKEELLKLGIKHKLSTEKKKEALRASVNNLVPVALIAKTEPPFEPYTAFNELIKYPFEEHMELDDMPF